MDWAVLWRFVVSPVAVPVRLTGRRQKDLLDLRLDGVRGVMGLACNGCVFQRSSRPIQLQTSRASRESGDETPIDLGSQDQDPDHDGGQGGRQHGGRSDVECAADLRVVVGVDDLDEQFQGGIE